MGTEKKKKKASKKISPEMREELLAEYGALREEITYRMGVRSQMLTYNLLVIGAILPFVLEDKLDPIALLIYPYFSFILATIWAKMDLRIGEIGEYIRAFIEPRLKGFKWQNYIKEQYQGKPISRFFRLTEIPAIGIFLGTQIIAIVLAVNSLIVSKKINAPETIILLILDGIILIATLVIINARKRKIYTRK